MASAIPLPPALKIAAVETKPAQAGLPLLARIMNDDDRIISLIHGNELLYS
jgi:hypothetical protein